jgi:MATE family multidrug resistance protein
MNYKKDLLRLGAPLVVGQLGQIVVGFADTLMIGRHSTLELAAASFVNNLFTLVLLFGMGFSYGLTPLVGSLYGRDEHTGIGCLLKNSAAVNLGLGLVLTLAMTVVYALLDRMGQPAELLPLMRPYFLMHLASVPFVMLFNACKQFTDGITDTRTSMWILLVGNVVNILGNYLFIYGHCGMPEWGLTGAGLSTLAARVLMLVAFVALFGLRGRYAVYRREFQASHLNRADARSLTRLGIPIALQMGMETASFNLSTIMVGWIGATALAAHQVMLTISQLGFMVYYGCAAAVSIRVSYYHGQGDFDKVRRTSTAGFQLILMSAVVVGVCVFVLRHRLGGWFVEDAEVSAAVSALVIPFVIYQFGDGMQINYANALRGIADVKHMMYYAFIAYFLISLPAGYLFAFPLGFGLTGIWMAFPLGLTSAGVMYWLRFRKCITSSAGQYKQTK